MYMQVVFVNMSLKGSWDVNVPLWIREYKRNELEKYGLSRNWVDLYSKMPTTGVMEGIGNLFMRRYIYVSNIPIHAFNHSSNFV